MANVVVPHFLRVKSLNIGIRERIHTCLRCLESDVLVFASSKEASSLISSAKERGGLSDPSFSSNRSFRAELETADKPSSVSAHRWLSVHHDVNLKQEDFVCQGYSEASSCLSSNCFLSSRFVSLRSWSKENKTSDSSQWPVLEILTLHCTFINLLTIPSCSIWTV